MDEDGYPICDFRFPRGDDLWDGVMQAGSGRMKMILQYCVTSGRHGGVSGAELWKTNLISITPGLLTRCGPDIL